ncbi:cytochrome P450 [Actinomycetospora straminea]|uniref:Cytochrome P450 n=1 Tax=Actinomycetospora straminea TaxID=663607 RepID=A0ABP9E1N5_9PSEU|nr:cytochrome P450 [Actinomycetospora straminea]MDD7930871.1 cytochrome P450 [Actinomycetospora straminea]
MTQTSSHGTCPFDPGVRRWGAPYPGREALRAAGPVVVTEAPAGGPVAVVTTAALARAVLGDPRLVKDTALAPPTWDPRSAGLEPTAADALSLTTAEGATHAALRRAHAPMLSPRRIRARAGAMRDAARELLGGLGRLGDTVDLTADFTTRYPLVVVGDLLGVPRGMLDDAVEACRRMWGDEADGAAAMVGFARLGAAAMAHDGLARELRARLPAGVTDDQVHYLLFALIFAGQLTTDAALGFLLARVLVDGPPEDTAALVDDVLRRDPPAPFTLWRFAAEDVEIAGTPLAAGTPVLVDLAGVADDPGPSLAFGAGPHVCAGAHLARVELAAAVDVLVTDFPDARLAVPADELRRVDPGGVVGSRLAALPVTGLRARDG